ncbi:hypothetical protein E2986_13916 [Frieseomelitta varia]|uniref:Uncharacterized protein n=1 Tax=Frieseomelitta varia TaxID=561572 RepID=A0A833RXI9_9HYME|nr:hypothetical protein E2986_13916 [Frieseomelitta varia]
MNLVSYLLHISVLKVDNTLPAVQPSTKPYVKGRDSYLKLPIYAIQRYRKYSEKLECFEADQFLNKKRVVNSGTYLPFGIESRKCMKGIAWLLGGHIAL